MALHAAAEFDGLNHNGNGAELTTSGRFESSYGIRCAMNPGSGTSDYISPGTGLGSFTTFWHRFYGYAQNSLLNGRTVAQYHNSSGTAVFRIQVTATSTIQAQYWNGSAWTNIGSTATVTNSVLNVYDLKIVCGGSGSFELYRDNSLLLSGSASMTSVTNIDEWRWMASNSSTTTTMVFAEAIWGDESTIGHRFCLAPPTGNGNYTAGSGDYTSVDEAVLNDSDFTTLTSNGDAETYTHSAMTLPSGTVRAVMVNGRVKNNATGAQNIKARLRASSTDYDQASNFSGIGVGYNPYRARWATNPAGGNWTQASASSTSQEFGYVAAT